jgi:NADH dehydrogenase
LSEGKIADPLRDLLRKQKNADFVLAEVTGIDIEGRRVLATRPLGDQLEFGYDYLIVAAGVQQSYFGHDEYATFAPGMKTIEDALVIRRRVFGSFEMADTATDPAERSRWLTFALVGAGPTGVELAGQIREVATRTPGCCFSMAGTSRSPRSARSCRPRRQAPWTSSASSSTSTRS